MSPEPPPYDWFVDFLKEGAMCDIVEAMGDDAIDVENMELHEAWPAVINQNNMKPVQRPIILHCLCTQRYVRLHSDTKNTTK